MIVRKTCDYQNLKYRRMKIFSENEFGTFDTNL